MCAVLCVFVCQCVYLQVIKQLAASSCVREHQPSPKPQAFRDNDRVSVQDEAFAQHLWQASGLQRIFSNMQLPDGAHPIGLNPNIRIYRYSTGQRFGKHIDESCETGPGQYTRFTLLIYLSGGGGGNPVVGGETVFYGMVGGATASAPVQHHTCCAATSQTNGAGCCAKCYQKQARHCCTCMGTTAWSTRGRWCGGGTSMCCARMWCLVCTNAL